MKLLTLVENLIYFGYNKKDLANKGVLKWKRKEFRYG